MNSFKHYLLVIAISVLPFISIFATPMAPHTHDSPVHFARMAAYYKALADGQVLPRWAGELNYGYGMPLFNFIYHVPYLVTSVPLALGGGLVFSFKAGLLISFVLSGVFMYLFSLHFFKHEGRALVATMLYQFAPFHLIDLLVRGDMAEGFALAFFPLLLFAVLRGFTRKRSIYSILFTGLAALLLILSHNSMSLVFFGVAALFALVFAPNKKKLVESAGGLFTGLLFSSFYWVPALLERKYTYGDLFMKDMYASHFAPLFHFLLPNFTNSETQQTGGISVSFGLMPILALFMALFYVVRKKIPPFNNDRKTVWFGLMLTLGAVFIMQPVSTLLWENIPILRMFQFPWRLLNVTTFSLALTGAIVFVSHKTSRLLLAGIMAITVLSSAVYFRPPLGFDRIDEHYFWNYPLNTTFFGETDVIWSAGPAGSYPEKRVEVIGGTGTIKNLVKKGTVHTFTVHANTDVQVVDRTQYFPGWRVYNGDQKLPVEFQDQNWRGLITFRLPPGTHNMRVVWENSPVRKAAGWTTIVSLSAALILLVLSVKRKGA